ncbi:hypothetical protein C1925_03475 [Stenotrophomonas sp. SAU14A_NAIMI4_5]|nr:hypothetical protein C1925_03475 [Stenotrophomonas sp. SAU14A_NAIMI4_5]
MAAQDCLARGSRDCEVVATFANKCAAIAVRPGVRKYVEAVDRLSAVKKDALKNCGSKECKIIFEGCAYP